MKSKRTLPDGAMVLGVIIMITAGIILFKFERGISKSKAAEISWIAVPAVITNIQFETNRGGAYERIVYKYSFDGKLHIGDRDGFSGGERWHVSANPGENRGHEVGENITIYIDSKNPTQSVRYLHPPSAEIVARKRLLCGVVLVLGAGLILWGAVRKVRGQP